MTDDVYRWHDVLWLRWEPVGYPTAYLMCLLSVRDRPAPWLPPFAFPDADGERTLED